MNRKNALSALLLVLAIALGGLRDFLFVNLNYQLDFLEHTRDESYAHSRFRAWVSGWSASDLSLAKWALAAAFILLTLALTLAMARMRFGDQRYRRPLLFAFGWIASLALLCHFGSRAWPVLEPISIKLLHGLQYPVPMLLVWALSWRSRPKEGTLSA